MVTSRFSMPDWPHSPVHRLSEAGTYMVTAGTYGKQALFRSPQRLGVLCEALLECALKHHWQLQAWAIFPNHYHFVGISPGHAGSLRTLVQHLHSVTARHVNELDEMAGRKVWFEYWDTQLTNQRSYLARLSYVHRNAVHHGLVREPSAYPWCSAGWFARRAAAAFYKTVMRFPVARVKVPDDYSVEPTAIA